MSVYYKGCTHFSRVSIVPFTFTLYFHFLALQPVCRSHSLGDCFLAPHEPHLHSILKKKIFQELITEDYD